MERCGNTALEYAVTYFFGSLENVSIDKDLEERIIELPRVITNSSSYDGTGGGP